MVLTSVPREQKLEIGDDRRAGPPTGGLVFDHTLAQAAQRAVNLGVDDGVRPRSTVGPDSAQRLIDAREVLELRSPAGNSSPDVDDLASESTSELLQPFLNFGKHILRVNRARRRGMELHVVRASSDEEDVEGLIVLQPHRLVEASFHLQKVKKKLLERG